MKSYAPRRPSPVRATARAIVLLLLAIVALLASGRLVVGVAPVWVEIESDGEILRIAADGTSRQVALPRPIVVVRPVAPIAFRREHQIDGSDSTNMLTFDPRYFVGFSTSPYYQFQALLREEWRYSTWTRLEVSDATGRTVIREPRPADEVDILVPPEFSLTVALQRPEIPRALELVDDQGRALTFEINRNDKYVRLGPRRTPDASDVTSWYFPRGWMPPLATLVDLITRVAALALGLILVTGALAALLPSPFTWQPGRRALLVALPVGLLFLLAASGYLAIALFDRAPHILDAIAYTFQAKTFASGMLWAPPPPAPDAFPMPFSTLHDERWFVQYPPGTAALLALGYLVRVPWLVQPLLAAGAVALIVLAVRRQYGPGTALLVLLLLVVSPFLLLTTGTFLSHVPALFFASVSLYAATRYAERPAVRWAALVAAGLGLAFLTREIVSLLFGLTVILAGLVRGAQLRGRTVVLDALVMASIVGAAAGLYLAYNAALTGNPLILPRLLVNGQDRYGFGSGIGFYNEHTVASGLVNTEEQLVSLGFYLGGWPFGFSLALPLLPFLTRRWAGWDASYGLLALAYIVSYTAYFYHGITFGPRYYFEALPAFIILTARGFAVITDSLGAWLTALGVRGGWWRARQATALVAAGLLACNVVYFMPRQATLYADYSGVPGGGPRLDDAIGSDLAGRTSLLEPGALVVADEWWWYTMYYAAMNCPRSDCPTVFALGDGAESREILRRVFPERRWYNVVEREGVLRIEPGSP